MSELESEYNNCQMFILSPSRFQWNALDATGRIEDIRKELKTKL